MSEQEAPLRGAGEALIRELEALHIGPDEVLVLHWKKPSGDGEGVETILEGLAAVGLKDRALVVIGDEWALAKVATRGGDA